MRARDAKRIGAIVATAALIVAPILLLRSCQSAGLGKTEARLATGQAGAAIESGSDAVDTIGNAAARETEIHTTVKDGTHAIAQAPAGDSNAAADRAVCKLRSYRDHPRCRAMLDAGAE